MSEIEIKTIESVIDKLYFEYLQKYTKEKYCKYTVPNIMNVIFFINKQNNKATINELLVSLNMKYTSFMTTINIMRKINLAIKDGRYDYKLTKQFADFLKKIENNEL